MLHYMYGYFIQFVVPDDDLFLAKYLALIKYILN
jgi:hypothetical protein